MTMNRDAAGRKPVAPTAVPPAGRAFGVAVVTLLTLSTLALVAIAALLGLVYLNLQRTDVAALKGDIAGVKSETASFHTDMAKAMAGLQKGLSDTSQEVDAATLKLNDIALSLHKAP